MWVGRVPQDEKISCAKRCLRPNTIDCKRKCKSKIKFYTNYLLKYNLQDNKTQSIIQQLPYETIVSVEGQVVARPTDMINKKQETGAIEVVIEKINILNSVSTKLPFNIREFQRANESLRMQHRYMDLRFLEMQRNLRTRSEMFMRMREFLVRRAHFVEVETPTLFKATPGVSILKDITKFRRVLEE